MLAELGARNVVNTKFTLVDNSENLIDSDIARIIRFQGTPGDIPAIMDREYDSIENRLIFRIKRAIRTVSSSFASAENWNFRS